MDMWGVFFLNLNESINYTVLVHCINSYMKGKLNTVLNKAHGQINFSWRRGVTEQSSVDHNDDDDH